MNNKLKNLPIDILKHILSFIEKPKLHYINELEYKFFKCNEETFKYNVKNLYNDNDNEIIFKCNVQNIYNDESYLCKFYYYCECNICQTSLCKYFCKCNKCESLYNGNFFNFVINKTNNFNLYDIFNPYFINYDNYNKIFFNPFLLKESHQKDSYNKKYIYNQYDCICDSKILKKNILIHFKTKKHIKFMNNINNLKKLYKLNIKNYHINKNKFK